MIFRLVLLAAVVYFIFMWLKRAAARGRAAPVTPQENMVTCAQCGVHLPQSDSIAEGARFYCTEEHRIAGPRQ
jgi:uncharacterized protein